jgi:hypothetical protein
MDPTLFLAGLIKIIWIEVGALWTKHQETLHAKANSNQSPAIRADLQMQVRNLHALQPHTRRIHQQTYFYPNLVKFLEQQGLQFQLQSYIDKYKPNIDASAAQARLPIQDQGETDKEEDGDLLPPVTDIRTKPTIILQPDPDPKEGLASPQLTDQNPAAPHSPSLHHPHTIPRTLANLSNDHTIHPALEEAQHRKRNRRRSGTKVINVITNFFSPLDP